jgi:hypothetical protein
VNWILFKCPNYEALSPRCHVLCAVLHLAQCVWTDQSSEEQKRGITAVIELSWVLEKLITIQLVKKLTDFYETRRFVTVFTRVRHLAIFLATRIWPTPLLSSRLCLDLPSGLFPSGFPSRILFALSHSPWFGRPTNIQWRIQIMELLIMHFSPSCCNLLPPRSKYNFCSLFLCTLNLSSSLNVID